jgi:excisionase family DNA binding protein
MFNPFDEIMQKLCDLQEEVRLIRLGSLVPTVQTETRNIEEEHLTVQEVADKYRLAKSTVLRYARNNTIPSYSAGKSYTFKVSELDKVLSSETPLRRKKRGGNAQ